MPPYLQQAVVRTANLLDSEIGFSPEFTGTTEIISSADTLTMSTAISDTRSRHLYGSTRTTAIRSRAHVSSTAVLAAKKQRIDKATITSGPTQVTGLHKLIHKREEVHEIR